MSFARQMQRVALFAFSSILISGALQAQIPGALDETFGGSARARVNFSDKVLTNAGGWDAVVQAPNNPADPNYRKIVMVGSSAEGTRPHFAMVRLNINGTRDMGFGADGAEGTVKEIDLGIWDTLTDVAIQPDNKIVVLGYVSRQDLPEDWRLLRYTPNGERDVTFSGDGLVEFNVPTDNAARTHAVAIDSSGRIYAAGNNTMKNGQSDMFVYRLTTSGAMDSSWGTNGMVKIAVDGSVSTKDEAWGIGIQASGKVVLAGRANNKPIVLRLNSTGTIDTTFGASGFRYLPIGSASTTDNFRGMALDSTDRIIAVGKYQGTYCMNSNSRGMVARFTKDGAVDTSFSGDGWAGQPSGRFSNYEDVEVDGSGRIVVTGQSDFSYCNESTGEMGQSEYQIAAYRFLDNGTPDPAFSYAVAPAVASPGTAYVNVVVEWAEQAHGIALQPNGDILVPSEGYAINLQHMMCVRFKGDTGALDTTFNANGQVLTSSINKPGVFATRLYGGSADYSLGTSVQQADGKTVLVGQTWNGWDYDFAVTRLTAAGILDLTFGSDDPDYADAARRTGKYIFDTGSVGVNDQSDVAYAVALQSDGKIVVAGTSTATAGSAVVTKLFRLTTSGALDESNFGTAGFATTNFGNANGQRPRAIIIQPGTNKIFLTGEVYSGGYSNLLLARFSADGKTLEKTQIHNYQNANNFEEGHAIAFQPDGKIVMGGRFGKQGSPFQFYVGRFDQEFVADSTFSLGRIWTAGGIIGADATNYQGFFPIPHETRPAPTQGTPNPLGTAISASDQAEYIVVEADGKITLGGRTVPTAANARPRYALTRLTSSGWIDPTFGTNGWVSTYFPGGVETNNHDSDIYTLLKQNDGKLIGLGTAGTTTNLDFAVARYNWDDGSLDTAFGTGGKSTIAVGQGSDFGYSGMMTSDGKIVIGGFDNIREDFIAARWQGDVAPINGPSAAPDLTTDSSRANYNGTADNITNVNNPTFSGTPCVVGQSVIMQISTLADSEHPYKARKLCRSAGGWTASVPKYPASGGGFVGQLPDGTWKAAAYAATGYSSTGLSAFLPSFTIDTVATVPTLTAPTHLQKMNAEQPITFSGGAVEEKSDVYVWDTTDTVWTPTTGVALSGTMTKLCTSFLAPAAGTWSCAKPAHPDPAALALGLHKVKVQQEDIAANSSVICVTGTQSGPGCANEHQFYVKANTTSAAATDADSQTVYGEPITFTTTVSTNVGIPDGKVIQTYKGAVLPPVGGNTVVPCVAAGCHTSTVTHAPAMPVAVGTHTYSSTYPETDKYFSSAASEMTHTVIKADTTTTLASSAAPSVFGQIITITPTIAVVSPGAGTPTGSLVIEVDTNGPINQANLNAFTVPGLSVGEHTIKVTYSGDGNFNGSSVTITQTVNKATTTTAVVSSSNPSIFDGSVTFTASVSVTSPGAGARTGTVTFRDGTTVIGTDAVSGTYSATLTTTALLGGTHSITAEYSGDASFLGSTSGGLTQTVNTKATTTTVVSSAHPAEASDPVTFTATVNDNRSTGTVEFFDGVASLGSGTVTAGVASISAASLTVGDHLIKGIYSGDTNFTGSTSPEIPQKVNRVVSTVVLTSSASPEVFGNSLTLTATLGDNRGTGTVTFKNGTTDLGTGPIVEGVATLVNNTLNAGTHSLTVVYSGDPKFTEATSDPLEQVITQSPSSITISAGLNPSLYGTPLTFTATVSNPGSSGLVTFKDASGVLGTGTISTLGVATYTTSTLTVGSHLIHAEYAGDANVASSTSDPIAQTVQVGVTVPGLISSINPSSFGESVTFTATIKTDATGSITFKNGAAVLGTVAVNSGTAAVSTATLPVGTHGITASYSGDANYAPTTSSELSQVVNKAATTTTVISAENPSTVEGSVTFTATVAVTAPGAGTPTGSMSFTVGSNPPVVVALTGLSASHSASFSTTGAHVVAVSYSGDTSFATSQTTLSGDQQVDKGTATVAVTTSASPSAYGSAVTFTATLTPVAPTTTKPTGTVTFLDGASSIGNGTLNASGVATLTTSSLSGGTRVIKASYAGDSLFETSEGTLAPDQVISKVGSTTVLVSSANPEVVGDTITFTATITPVVPGLPAAPTGSVAFDNGGTPMGSVALTNGVATISTSSLAITTHTINAVYGGDANYSGSNDSESQVIVADTPPVAVDDAVNTPRNIPLNGNVLTNDSDVNGDALTAVLVANVSTGTLSFNADGTFLYTPPNPSFMGQTSFTYDALARGVHSNTATVTITVTASAPISTAVSPDSGDVAGGAITITGSQFYAGATITIGGQSVPAVVVNETTITSTVPAGLLPGTLNDIVVTNLDTGVGTGSRLYMQNFTDVIQTNPLHPFVEKIFRRGVTAGCGGGNYCPAASIQRQHMAVFLLLAKYGPTYVAPTPVNPKFTDVAANSPFKAWVEQLAVEKITSGCTPTTFCPTAAVSREHAPVFVLVAKEGITYVPPPFTMFLSDVPSSSPFAKWIQEMYVRNATTGCGVNLYCPTAPITRGQMAVFLSQTWGW